jgi:hypothetical protein
VLILPTTIGPAAIHFIDLLDAHGPGCRVAGPTQDRGGASVLSCCSMDDLPLLIVAVIDMGPSQHFQLCWSVIVSYYRYSYTSITMRPWRSIDGMVDLGSSFGAFALCRPDARSGFAVDGLSRIYNTVIMGALGRLVSTRTGTRRHHPSDSCFNHDCPMTKCRVRALEQFARHVQPSDSASAAVRTGQRCALYRVFLHEKRGQSGETRFTSNVHRHISCGN